ncbi:MAG: HAD family hydrolase [Fimbriimonadaceae bacterium]|jgi:putative hydrolase of the HAD superfamily|nr:HAD family hydrolase [Fimbriimonadaceae bacterium]
MGRPELVPGLEGIKAIYFDLDDTLCAYWDAAKTGLRKAFGDHPDLTVPMDLMLKEWAIAFSEFVETIGKTHWYEKYLKSGDLTRAELMRRTLERVGIFDEDLALDLSNRYHVERHAALDLFPESIEVLEKLRGFWPVGVITNGPADIQQMEIEKLNLRPYFDHVFIEGEMGFGKPDERVFALARKAVGCEPGEILMVGNSYKHDVVPALENGWKTVWVRRPSDVPPSSRTGRPEEKPATGPEPTLIIKDLAEIFA